MARTATNTLIMALLVFTACKDVGLNPQARMTLRDINWTRDTVGIGNRQMMPYRIWGSSPRDVYAVGHSSDLFIGKILHFNGTSWEDLTPKYVEAFPGQTIYGFTPMTVFGFGSSDVWIVGIRDTSYNYSDPEPGFAMHFNGNSWSGWWPDSSVAYNAVWGVSSNNLWLGSLGPYLTHFDGTSWTRYDIADSVWFQRILGNNANEVYASGTFFGKTGIQQTKYYKWDGLQWSLEESRLQSDPSPGFDALFTISNGSLISYLGNTVTRRISKGTWELMLQVQQASFWDVSSLPSGDIFAIGGTRGERAFHFNGADWYRYPELADSNLSIAGVWSDGTEVFAVETEIQPSNTLWSKVFILHGK